MKVLIITKSNDHEGVNLTIEAIRNSGNIPIRFDTDLYPTEVQLDINFGKLGDEIILNTNDVSCNLREIDCVYYRRVAYGQNIPNGMDVQYRNACVNEIKSVFEGLLTNLDAFYLDKIWAVRRASMKQLQLKLARKLGLEIPDTLISNNPLQVKEFAQKYTDGIVTKMHTSFAIYDEGQEKVVFTSKVGAEDLENLEGLKYSPMIFQEFIEKELDLRVTIVGNKVFCSALNAQKNPISKVDWRCDGARLATMWEPYLLPQEVVEKLLVLMNGLDLNYGAADFVLTPEGKLIFLEVNPVGEYFWLDKQHGNGISRAIAECIKGENRRVE